MTGQPITTSDPTYHDRHAKRSLRRARQIAGNIESGIDVLDVGCNIGITSQHLLDTGKAVTVTGIELHRSTVSPSLLQDPRFKFIEGNIADIELHETYDTCVYGAVHHHVLRTHGLNAAIRAFQMLAEHCDSTLFFETGQISEGGQWNWQRALREYFRTDEEHFFYMLRAIEHLIIDFSVIGKFWIHGVRRAYLRIDMKPVANRKPVRISGEVMQAPDADAKQLVRRFQHKHEDLHPATGAPSPDSPNRYWIQSLSDSDRLFIKQHIHHPVAAMCEWSIGRGIDRRWAIRPCATTQLDGSLVFPYLENCQKIGSFIHAPAEARRTIARQLLEIFSFARISRATLSPGLLLAAPNGGTINDFCDLNCNNFLVTTNFDRLAVHAIDFEQQSTGYAYRNRLNLALMLWTLGQFRMRACYEFFVGIAAGIWSLLKSQLDPIDVRIRHRQPSLLSVLVAEFRSRTGVVVKVALDKLRGV